MNEDKNTHLYDNIINLPHPTSTKHPRMSLYDRAAQFSPFAALTGYEAAITETARLTDGEMELDEDAKEKINEKLNWIRDHLKEEPKVTITYFIPDEKKTGGRYITCTGTVKKVKEYEHLLILKDETTIPIQDIKNIVF